MLWYPFLVYMPVTRWPGKIALFYKVRHVKHTVWHTIVTRMDNETDTRHWHHPLGMSGCCPDTVKLTLVCEIYTNHIHFPVDIVCLFPWLYVHMAYVNLVLLKLHLKLNLHDIPYIFTEKFYHTCSAWNIHINEYSDNSFIGKMNDIHRTQRI